MRMSVAKIYRRLLPLSLLALPHPALAQDRVHSDLPLFSGKNEEIWPKGFADKEGQGCSSRVAFGDWKYVSLPGDADPDVLCLSHAGDLLEVRPHG